jgi:integrase
LQDNGIYLSIFFDKGADFIYFEDFLLYCKNLDYTKNTIKTYKNSLLRFNALSFSLFAIDLHLLNNSQFAELIKRSRELYTASTINTTLSVLQQYFNYLSFAHGVAVKIQVDKYYQKINEKKRTYISVTDLHYLLDNCVNSDILQLAFLLLYATGIRTAELVNLRYKDITVSNDLLKLDIINAKNRLNRSVYALNFDSIETSVFYKSFIDNQIILDHNAKPFATLTMQLHRALYNYNTTSTNAIELHDFRRSFATNLAKRNIRLEQIRDILGHKNINTTVSYIIREETDFIEIANSITL